jgi:hypothetical protein
MAEFWTNYIWPLIVMVAQSVLLLVLLLLVTAYVLYADRKIWAAVQDQARTKRGRALGAAAVLRRSHQVRGQGTDYSRRCQQGRVPARAARDGGAGALRGR